MGKDYYKILGVEKGATKEEIKKAYKKLAKKYHPDISKEPDAEQKFKEINEAASVLLDDEKRKQYDTYGTTDNFNSGFSGFDPSDFGIDLSDIFDDIFTSFFGFNAGGSASRGKKRRRYSDDIEVELSLTLEEVYNSTVKEIKVKRKVECDKCHGRGAVKESDVETCPKCGGSGVVTDVRRTMFGVFKTEKTCPYCQGEGVIIKNPCPKCGGKGYVETIEKVKVKVPKGVENGVRLRMGGKGNYTPDYGYGDLYIMIKYKEDKIFDVEENDLYTSLNINFIQAIFGNEIELDYFGNKKLVVKIPEGTQPGTILRLKGKGLPKYETNKYGDLYVKVNVEIPTKLTKKQKELLKEFAKEYKNNSFFKKIKDFLS